MTVGRTIQKHAKRALGFAISWHSLRTTHVSRSVELEQSPAVVMTNTSDRVARGLANRPQGMGAKGFRHGEQPQVQAHVTEVQSRELVHTPACIYLIHPCLLLFLSSATGLVRGICARAYLQSHKYRRMAPIVTMPK